MGKDQRLPLERHQYLAKRLRDLHLGVKELSTELFDAFSTSGTRGKPWNDIRKAETAIYLTRVHAEKNYVKDYGDEADPYVYFPDQEPLPGWPGERS